ncbi:MAG TPA: hypothetical protein VKR29_06810, partial [Candidatus Binataceae bacterium]|nr:hypothetical protein [Candidatus Binataceae bacterium]
MMRHALAAAAGVLLAVAFAGCTPVVYSTADSVGDTVKGFIPSGDLQAHAVRSIKQVKAGRIAVMPIVAN